MLSNIVTRITLLGRDQSFLFLLMDEMFSRASVRINTIPNTKIR
jgi:hypothetical protein